MSAGTTTPPAAGGPQVIEAALTWTGAAFEPGLRVAVDAAGRIEAVGDLDRRVTVALPDRALLPGLVSAHSHAFQRALRGRGERFPGGADSFWGWREAMYDLVGAMDAETLLGATRRAYEEMRAAGITTVGEFHYLHHDGERDWAFDRVVLEAARQADVRLVLLQAYYTTGAVGRPLGPAQRRFDGVSPEVFWERFDALEDELTANQSLGCVVHSLRAASLEDLVRLHVESVRRDLPFHLHLEEQRREVAEVEAAYGRRPLALVNERLAVDERLTIVHATHATAEDLGRFQDAGGRVCLCPLTEANLGDGIPEHGALRPDRLCLGTDSNARLDLFEEARWLEYAARLASERRGVHTDGEGRVARPLLQAATRGGALSLGLPSGALAPGFHADFATVDLTRDELRGQDADHLAEALVFGAGAEVVAETCVGGRWRARGRRAP